MLVRELNEFIGKNGLIELSGLIIRVNIKNVKERWGKTRYLVTPLAGSGEIWVENIRIDVEEK
jgi:hypothetical protein